MFGLFRRTKIEAWETDLLRNTLKKLPAEYHHFEKQIDEKLFRRVLTGLSDLPGYVAFSFNPQVFEKFSKQKEPNYKITGIKISDKKSFKNLDYTIYISNGIINGYSIEGAQKFDIDLQVINVENFKIEYYTNKDYEELAESLTISESKLINQDDIYKVTLEDKVYYHIKDLEDGDFIGMDKEKNIYKLTHDPYEIVKLDCTLKEALRIEA